MPGFGGHVRNVVPSGFEAYARVFHPADRDGLPVRWAEVAAENGKVMHPAAQFYGLAPDLWTQTEWYPQDLHPPGLGQLPDVALRALLDVLGRHTVADQQCYFAIWEGYGDLPHNSASSVSYLRFTNGATTAELPDRVLPEELLDVEHAPRVLHPHRSYFLFTGHLEDAVQLKTGDFARWMRLRPPNLMWPGDDSWCVATEIDFDSTLIGGSRHLVDDILADGALEAAEVALHISLEWQGDGLNQMPDYGRD
jgi:hypothetical protein